MLNCIIATMRPKARTNSPSTPASFMRRSTVSALVLRGQDFEEQPVRLLVVAHFWIDQLERAGRGAHRVGMESEIVLLRQMEQADQIDRIAPEHVGRGDVDAVVVDDEIVGLGIVRRLRAGRKRAITRLEHRRGLGLRAPPGRRTGWR